MINDTTTRVIYTGDGVTKEFPFGFQITNKNSIRVVIADTDGNETELKKDYFVDENKKTVFYPGYAPGEEPAQADIPPLLEEGEKIAIIRETQINQLSTFGRKWPFYVGELGLDKLTMIAQELKQLLERTMLIGDTQNEGVKKLKIPAGKPNAIIGWDWKGEKIINRSDFFEHFKKSMSVYEKLSDLKKDRSLTPGMTVTTTGYYKSADGGGGTYSIKLRTKEPNGYSSIELNNGLVAELLIENNTINVKQFGAIGDGITDDTAAIQAAIDRLPTLINGTVLITGEHFVTSVTISHPVDIMGGGKLISKTTPVIINNKWKTGSISHITFTGDVAGIEVKNVHNFQINNCRFVNCKKFAIKVNNGNELYVNNCAIRADGGCEGTGIYCVTSDCSFTDIVIQGYKFGIYNRGQNTYTRIHAWVSGDGFYEGSTFMDSNITNSIQCYTDSFQYGYKLFGGTRHSIVNPVFYWNTDYYPKTLTPVILNLDKVDTPVLISGMYLEIGKLTAPLASLPIFSNKNVQIDYDFFGINQISDDKVSGLPSQRFKLISEVALKRNVGMVRAGMATINIIVSLKNITFDSDNNAKIATIPQRYKPIDSLLTYARIINGDIKTGTLSSICYTYISENNGDIKICTAERNKFLEITISYPIAR